MRRFTLLPRCMLLVALGYCAIGWHDAQANPPIILKGRVLERGRREPVEGAVVYLKPLKRDIYTDAKGLYQFKIKPGKYELIIKAVGYLGEKQKLDLKQGPVVTHDIYLLPDPASPLQSVVRARREKQSSQQITATQQQMQQAPGTLGGDPFRFFQNMPGVARASRTSGALIVRGADFADTGFYVDGHRIPFLYHFGAGLTVLNRRFLDRVDFYPSGAPLRYGRLTAGLVSAHSQSPSITSVHGEVYVDLTHAGFYLEIPIGKQWTIAAAASRSYIDVIFGALTKDPLVGAFWDYQLKIAWQTKHHQFSVFFLGSDDYYDYSGKQLGPEIPLIGRGENTRALRFLRMIAKYSYTNGPLTFRTSLATGFNQDLSATPTQKDETWEWPVELRVDFLLKLHKTLRMDFGLDGLWNYQVFDFRLPSAETAGFPKPVAAPFDQISQGQRGLLAPGLYLSFLWRPHARVNIRLGVRSDIYAFQDRILPGFDPRLSATFDLHRDWKALLSVGLYHRSPLPVEWSNERGNPDLQLVRAFQLAAGAEYRYREWIQVRAQFFYNQMFQLVVPSDKIITRNGALVSERYNNDGFGRALGMELLVRFQILHRLYGWVSYTLSRAERGRAPGDGYTPYEFDQPHILNFMLRWRIGAGWSMSARFRLASGNPVPALKQVSYDADTDNYRGLFDTNTTERLPLFHQLDLRVDKTFTFNTWRLGIYLDIINVYNAKSAEEFRYSYNYKTRRPINGIPFFPVLGLRGEF